VRFAVKQKRFNVEQIVTLGSLDGSGVLHAVHMVIPGGFFNPHCGQSMAEGASLGSIYHIPLQARE
jgi:hypothetical protein